MAEKFKIKKGDKVIVLTGRDKGKQGEVLEVLRPYLFLLRLGYEFVLILHYLKTL